MIGEPVPPLADATPRRHVVIAGTGRAGTSFLVRFLGRCGLDVGFPTGFDRRARAGLEHYLLDEDVPYVVKDPWLFTYCDDVDLGQIGIDALIVPVRDPLVSARSRVLQDRIAMAEGPWAGRPPSDVTCSVPAGVIYSLDPIDQARILAVGFHKLIYWATLHQLPLYLLEFPRAVNDCSYLLDTLWPWLEDYCTRQQAESAFRVVANPRLVRVYPERDPTRDRQGEQDLEDVERLDREALTVLLSERVARLARAEDQLAEMQESLMEGERLLSGAQHRIAVMEDLLTGLEGDLTHCHRRLDAATAENAALRGTVSWKVTRPLRAVRARRRPKKRDRAILPLDRD